jgi:hypothetical protein
MALTTSNKKCYINPVDPTDKELILAILSRYQVSSDLPSDNNITINNILLIKNGTQLKCTVNTSAPNKFLAADSTQIKKLIIWLESEYVPSNLIVVGNSKVLVDDDGIINLDRTSLTKTELQNILNAIP